MHDNFDLRDGEGGSERERGRRSSEPAHPVTDREVPLGVAPADVINRWLDGEAPEPTGLRGDAARQVDFWRQIGEETERRRHVTTPRHVEAQIMAAIARESATAAAAVIAPWHRRSLQLNQATALAIGTGLLLLGAALGALMR